MPSFMVSIMPKITWTSTIIQKASSEPDFDVPAKL